MNHIVFPCRQCGLAGVMLLRIRSSQNFSWKMASPSWVSLFGILFLSFCFSVSFAHIPLYILLFFRLTFSHFHQSPTQSNIFIIFFPSSLCPAYVSMSWLCFLSLCSFPWDMEEALVSKTLAFENFAINLRKHVENTFM